MRNLLFGFLLTVVVTTAFAQQENPCAKIASAEQKSICAQVFSGVVQTKNSFIDNHLMEQEKINIPVVDTSTKKESPSIPILVGSETPSRIPQKGATQPTSTTDSSTSPSSSGVSYR